MTATADEVWAEDVLRVRKTRWWGGCSIPK